MYELSTNICFYGSNQVNIMHAIGKNRWYASHNIRSCFQASLNIKLVYIFNFFHAKPWLRKQSRISEIFLVHKLLECDKGSFYQAKWPNSFSCTNFLSRTSITTIEDVWSTNITCWKMKGGCKQEMTHSYV